MTIFGPQGYKGSKGDPVSLTLSDFLSCPFPTVGGISTEHGLGLSTENQRFGPEPVAESWVLPAERHNPLIFCLTFQGERGLPGFDGDKGEKGEDGPVGEKV